MPQAYVTELEEAKGATTSIFGMGHVM